MIKTYRTYKEAVRQMGPIRWEHIRDEWVEFVEEPSWEEFFDGIHSLCQLLRIPLISFLLAYPTAKKHAARVLEYGCARSWRNHEAAGEACPCKH